MKKELNEYKEILTGAIIGDIVGSIYEFDNHITATETDPL